MCLTKFYEVTSHKKRRCLTRRCDDTLGHASNMMKHFMEAPQMADEHCQQASSAAHCPVLLHMLGGCCCCYTN
jgi:hypothetical protein